MFDKPLHFAYCTTKCYQGFMVDNLDKTVRQSNYYKRLYKPYPDIEGYERFSDIALLFSAYLYLGKRELLYMVMEGHRSYSLLGKLKYVEKYKSEVIEYKNQLINDIKTLIGRYGKWSLNCH